jgi:sirohydrochlorin ferrochelatase
MEQDHIFQRHQPLGRLVERNAYWPEQPRQAARGPALLVAAHGERGGAATNEGVRRLVAGLATRAIAAEVGFGLLSGTPSIADGLLALRATEVLVYPLFLADGFFAAARLPRLIAAANAGAARTVRLLPPLGLDPPLAALVARRADEAARRLGAAAAQTTVVLLAHGSTRDQASRTAAGRLAALIAARRSFRAVRVAVLEGGTTLGETLDAVRGPAVVVGLFAGEGLHGAEDVPALLAARDVGFAGNVGAWRAIAGVVEAAVSRATDPATGRIEVCAHAATPLRRPFGSRLPKREGS